MAVQPDKTRIHGDLRYLFSLTAAANLLGGGGDAVLGRPSLLGQLLIVSFGLRPSLLFLSLPYPARFAPKVSNIRAVVVLTTVLRARDRVRTRAELTYEPKSLVADCIIVWLGDLNGRHTL